MPPTMKREKWVLLSEIMGPEDKVLPWGKYSAE